MRSDFSPGLAAPPSLGPPQDRRRHAWPGHPPRGSHRAALAAQEPRRRRQQPSPRTSRSKTGPGRRLGVAHKGVLQLHSKVWVDVEEFEAAAAGDLASLSRAVELYRGDLCPEDPYAEALGTRRRELRERFMDAGLKLAGRAVEGCDWETAIDALRRLLALAPGEEQRTTCSFRRSGGAAAARMLSASSRSAPGA